MLVLEWKIGDAPFLFHRKLRPMKQKTLREDAHSREAETCRKRPRSARECAKAHSQTVDKALLLQSFAIVGTAFLI